MTDDPARAEPTRSAGRVERSRHGNTNSAARGVPDLVSGSELGTRADPGFFLILRKEPRTRECLEGGPEALLGDDARISLSAVSRLDEHGKLLDRRSRTRRIDVRREVLRVYLSRHASDGKGALDPLVATLTVFKRFVAICVETVVFFLESSSSRNCLRHCGGTPITFERETKLGPCTRPFKFDDKVSIAPGSLMHHDYIVMYFLSYPIILYLELEERVHGTSPWTFSGRRRVDPSLALQA